MSCVGTRVKYIGGNCCIKNQKGIIIDDYDIKMARVRFDTGEIYRLRKLNLIKLNESEDNNMAKLEGYNAVAVTKEGCYGKKYSYAVYDDGKVYVAGDKIVVSGANK